MLVRLKYILDSFSDNELENMGLWIDSNDTIKSILVEDDDIVLITEDADLKINGMEEH